MFGLYVYENKLVLCIEKWLYLGLNVDNLTNFRFDKNYKNNLR